MKVPYLPVTPTPSSKESPLGYLLRVVERNGYPSITSLLNLVGYSYSAILSTRIDFQKFSPLVFDKDLSGLNYHSIYSFSRRDKVENERSRRVVQGFWRIQNPQFCMLCVEDFGFIESFWDLRISVVCPRHGTYSINVCHSCDSKVSWMRPSLNECKCGAGYQDQLHRKASSEMKNISGLLYAFLYGEDIESYVRRGGFPELDISGMSLDRLLKIIEILARFNLFSHGNGDYKVVPNSIEMLKNAEEVLRNWPKNYHLFLRRLGGAFYESNWAKIIFSKSLRSFLYCFV